MATNDFAGSHDNSAHEQLIWEYVNSLSTREIDKIINRAERRVENMAHGMLMAGRPLSLNIRKRLVQTAILRELNVRAS